MLKRKSKKGFTLVELIVTIAILAVLSGTVAGITVSSLNKAKNDSAASEANGILTNFQNYLAQYKVDGFVITDVETGKTAIQEFSEQAKTDNNKDILFDTGNFKAGEHKYVYQVTEVKTGDTVTGIKFTLSCNKVGTRGKEPTASWTYVIVNE